MSKDNAARIAALVAARVRGDAREVDLLRALLVVGNEGLVRRLAARYGKSRSEADVEDLVQAGAMGLLRALDSFDPTRGIKFSTYATHWIRDHMQRWGGKAEAVTRPRGTSMPAPIAKAAARHRALRGTEPTAQDLGISDEDLTAWSQAPHFIPASTASVEGDEGMDLPDERDTETMLEEALTLKKRWGRASRMLSERDLRIGWAVLVEGESLRSVAEQWDLSHIRVLEICERVAMHVERVPA